MVFSVLTKAQTLPSYVPANGMVAWWPFNGNANDESGNGNNGTVYGATLTNDRSNQANQAYNFTSDSVVVSNSANFDLTKFTISGWFKTTSTSGVYETFLDHSSGKSTFNGYWVGVYLGKATMYLANGSTQIDISASINVNDGNWHLLTGVYDGAIGFVYLDGKLTKSAAYVMTLKSERTTIGSNYLQQHFSGNLDDIGVWNRALTQQEITGLYYGWSVGNETTISQDIIRIGPNPASDFIALDIAGHIDLTACNVKIYTALGQEVFKSELSAQHSLFTIQHLPAGIYYLKVIQDDHTIFLRQLVK